jgi:hypothetical protein
MTEATPIDLIDPVVERKPRKRNGALVKAEAANHVAPLPDHGDPFLNLVERASRDTSIDLDKLQRLLDMREKIDAQAREREFNDRMAEAQKEMRPVSATTDNTQTKSKYANYAALDKALRPIYTKHGFALSFNTSPDAPDGYVRIVCDVTNAGHTRRYQIDMPADGKGAKGGDVMTKTHATGSAASYGMRYLLKMIFNVAVGEADDDGNAAGNKAPAERITEKQLAHLNALMQKTHEPAANVQITLQRFKVDSLSDLTPKQYDLCVKKLNEAIGAHND